MSVGSYIRGSEWRQWDLHIHTPASFHWLGERFGADPSSAASKALVDQMIQAMNVAEPAVFALMDYWTFDGWFALQRRLKEPDAPKLKKKVFPGIEFRLMAPMEGRLNAHVLFSDEIEDQLLELHPKSWTPIQPLGCFSWRSMKRSSKEQSFRNI